MILKAASGKDSSVVKSVARTLQTLEFFDRTRSPACIAKVSAALGYPQSSTAAILKSMVLMGYLDYDPRSRNFTPTDRVALTGNWINPALYRGGRLPAMLESIARQTSQTVFLACRNGDDAQFIHVVEAEAPARSNLLGTSVSLATPGVGLALLGTLDDNQIKRMFHRINAYRECDTAWIDAGEILRKVHDVRHMGYSGSERSLSEADAAIAMVLPKSCSGRPLAFGVFGQAGRLELQKASILSIMRNALAAHFGSLKTYNAAHVPTLPGNENESRLVESCAVANDFP